MLPSPGGKVPPRSQATGCGRGCVCIGGRSGGRVGRYGGGCVFAGRRRGGRTGGCGCRPARGGRPGGSGGRAAGCGDADAGAAAGGKGGEGVGAERVHAARHDFRHVRRDPADLRRPRGDPPDHLRGDRREACIAEVDVPDPRERLLKGDQRALERDRLLPAQRFQLALGLLAAHFEEPPRLHRPDTEDRRTGRPGLIGGLHSSYRPTRRSRHQPAEEDEHGLGIGQCRQAARSFLHQVSEVSAAGRAGRPRARRIPAMYSRTEQVAMTACAPARQRARKSSSPAIRRSAATRASGRS